MQTECGALFRGCRVYTVRVRGPAAAIAVGRAVATRACTAAEQYERRRGRRWRKVFHDRFRADAR